MVRTNPDPSGGSWAEPVLLAGAQPWGRGWVAAVTGWDLLAQVALPSMKRGPRLVSATVTPENPAPRWIPRIEMEGFLEPSGLPHLQEEISGQARIVAPGKLRPWSKLMSSICGRECGHGKEHLSGSQETPPHLHVTCCVTLSGLSFPTGAIPRAVSALYLSRNSKAENDAWA